MRGIFLILALGLTLAAAVLPPPADSADPVDGTPLTVATDEWPPYEYEADGEVVGIATDVLYAVFDAMGVAARPPRQYPWKRGLAMLEQSELDVLYAGVRRESRLAFARYPDEPLVVSRWVAMVREDGPRTLDFTGLESLSGHRVGLVNGYAYTSEINAWARTAPNAEWVPSDELMLRMLVNGRVDYALCDALNCRALVRRLGLGGAVVERFAPPLAETRIFPLFSRERVDETFVRRFSDALRTFKATPAYGAILRRYLGDAAPVE